MLITSLGHAGFCVETEAFLLIMDPWLSTDGAFDSAWFQFPQNHHLAAFVQAKLQQTAKPKYIYISHAHKDHFDIAFLRSLHTRDFTMILPDYRRTELVDALSNYECKEKKLLKHREKFELPGGYVKLFIDDSEMDRDSAILVHAAEENFLNVNDCKIHDQLAGIQQSEGPVDIFTAQFSGAGWHPTCYQYPKQRYAAISQKKKIGKFDSVRRAIETLKPAVYLTSAGPPCFLDPILMHLNFEAVSIFPKGDEFIRYLNLRLKTPVTQVYEPMPGDVLDSSTKQFVHLAQNRISGSSEGFKKYIDQYASQYALFFQERKLETDRPAEEIMSRLQKELRRKLNALELRERVKIPLYFGILNRTNQYIKVDFQKNRVSKATSIKEMDYYAISSYSWEIARVLDRRITWEDFTLTFRLQIHRKPDIYETLIHGFLMMETEDMNWFCRKVLNAEANEERLLLSTEHGNYSVNRYCPHQGADLSHGWLEQDRYLVCPRHRWMFDLKNNGDCTVNRSSIKAFPTD